MAEFILHIGLHKTATSSLQKNVFPKIPGITYHPLEIFLDEIRHVAKTDKEILDIEYVKSTILTHVKPGRNLFSAEIFSGSPLLGYTNRSTILELLKEIFGQPQIVLVLREQTSWMRSMYKHMIKHGSTESIKNIVYSKGKATKQTSFVHLDSLEYDRLVNQLHSLFGHENVAVFFYEDFAKEPNAFCNEMMRFVSNSDPVEQDFVGPRRGEGYSEPFLLFLRRLNHLRNSHIQGGLFRFSLRWLRLANRIFPKWRRTYFDHFATYKSRYLESNRRLAQILDRRLPPEYEDH